MNPFFFVNDMPPTALIPLFGALVALIATLGLIKSRRVEVADWVQAHLSAVAFGGYAVAGTGTYAIVTDQPAAFSASGAALLFMVAAAAIVAENRDQWRLVPAVYRLALDPRQ